MADVKDKYIEIKKTIPDNITIVAVTKQRTIEEIEEAVDAGITIVGENYVQEAMSKYRHIEGLQWHIIGHLQRNKVKDVLKIFNCIQSVDSMRLAVEIDTQCAKLSKIMPILIEINIGGEESKYGIKTDEVLETVRQIARLPNLHIEGLMTLEPYFDDPKNARTYFKLMKQVFDGVKSQNIPNVDMKTLSMGISNSYEVAIEEGSNMIRIGTKLFGPR
jgi:PLP dependent protein